LKKNSNKVLAFIDANFFIYLNCISDDMQRKPYEDFYVKIITSYKLSTDILVLDELIYISKIGQFSEVVNAVRNIMKLNS